MLGKLVLSVLLLGAVQSRSLDSAEEKPILESLKEFAHLVERYNLNVSIIGSHKKYASEGWTKEDMAVTMYMPPNSKHFTVATLTDDKQDKYLQKLRSLSKKENVGLKTRVIKIQDGEDKLASEQSINEQYLIDSPGYRSLTSFKNGVQGFAVPANESNLILYNYLIQDSSDPVQTVQVITGQVIVNEKAVSKDFPVEVLQEIKNILPKLWLTIDEQDLLARLLGQHLDKKFDGNHQVLVGIDNFALGEKKFANLAVADSNVIVYLL